MHRCRQLGRDRPAGARDLDAGRRQRWAERVHAGARRPVTVLVLARGVVQVQCSGTLDAARVEQLFAALERYRPTAQKVAYFVDLAALENYDPSFRPAWLDWARRSAEMLGGLHVCA